MKTCRETSAKPRILIATSNLGKVGEFKYLFQNTYQIVIPDEIGMKIDSEEIYTSYEENARLKAVNGARQSRLVTIADDSGLEVDALGGKPGSRSARYAGEKANDAQNMTLLLSQLTNVPWPERTARFVCVIAIVTPEGRVEFCRGECSGLIAFEPRGQNGFGYDPVFYLPDFGKTMAELTLDIKNQVSHRGKAIKAALEILPAVLTTGACL